MSSVGKANHHKPMSHARLVWSQDVWFFWPRNQQVEGTLYSPTGSQKAVHVTEMIYVCDIDSYASTSKPEHIKPLDSSTKSGPWSMTFMYILSVRTETVSPSKRLSICQQDLGIGINSRTHTEVSSKVRCTHIRVDILEKMNDSHFSSPRGRKIRI